MAAVNLLPGSARLDQMLTLAPEMRRAVARAEASNLRVIGAVARGEDGGARVDLLVNGDPNLTFFKLFRLEEELSVLLGVEVHVATDGEHSVATLARVESEAIAL